MMYRAWLCTAAALLAAGLSACVGGTAREEGIVRIGNGAEPEGLDPHIVTGVPEHNVLSCLFEGLVRMDPEDLSIVPGVAERWEVSPDGKTVTFALDEEGSFQWNHEDAGSGGVLSGGWTIDDEGYLVLTGENVQLVGDITLDEQGAFRFILAGSPEGDPGLLFQRQ